MASLYSVGNGQNVGYDNFMAIPTGSIVSTEREWAERAKRLMKSELKRADVTYEELARRLSAAGFRETKASVASKLSRGAFSAAFFLASMHAVGRHALSLDEV